MSCVALPARDDADNPSSTHPQVPAFQLFALRASGSRIKNLRLQIPESGESVAIGLKLLRDLLHNLEFHPQRFTVIVKPGVNRESNAGDLIRKWGAEPDRVQLHRTHLFKRFLPRTNGKAGILPNGANRS